MADGRVRPTSDQRCELIGPAAVLGCLYLFTSLSTKTIEFFFAWNTLGVAVYLLFGRQGSRLKAIDEAVGS